MTSNRKRALAWPRPSTSPYDACGKSLTGRLVNSLLHYLDVRSSDTTALARQPVTFLRVGLQICCLYNDWIAQPVSLAFFRVTRSNLRVPKPFELSGLPRPVAQALFAAFLLAVAVLTCMVTLQQTPLAHLSNAHGHEVSEQHAESVAADSTDAHIELESAHDLDDGNPADVTDCCVQTTDYVSTPNVAIPGLTVQSDGAASLMVIDRPNLRTPVMTVPLQTPSLTELSLQRV
jgi:hypothetical protein